MSSTNRGGQRSPADYYPTPAWCVRRLLEVLPIAGGRWLEPAAGDGAIIRAVNAVFPMPIEWSACELRSECRADLEPLAPGRVTIGDFFTAAQAFGLGGAVFDVIISNPPFSLAMEFVEASLKLTDTVVMLLRLNFLASEGRNDFMRANTPDVFVLPNRPSFKGGGKTDSIEYGWFVWRKRGPLEWPRLGVLGLTPASERKAPPVAEVGTDSLFKEGA